MDQSKEVQTEGRSQATEKPVEQELIFRHYCDHSIRGKSLFKNSEE